jgi:hypothetical protein
VKEKEKKMMIFYPRGRRLPKIVGRAPLTKTTALQDSLPLSNASRATGFGGLFFFQLL